MPRRGSIGVMAFVVLGGVCGRAAAAERPSLVLHIDDRVQVAAEELAAARVEVERTFLAADVEIGWAEGRFPASIARANIDSHARHLAVMVVNNGDEATRGGSGCALGFATPGLAVAHVFYNRIVDLARTRPVDLAVVLGRVIAHEVGHLVLPPNSHSRYGIMRADLDLGLANPHRFTDDQARAIRARIAAGSSRP